LARWTGKPSGNSSGQALQRRDRYNTPPEGSLVDAFHTLRPIGHIESPLVDPATAPKQGDEGAPDVSIVLDEQFGDALRGLAVGDEVLVLTWLHRARRDLLLVHPRDNPANPLRGVFATRSADRPNPIGIHRVRILAIDGARLHVKGLEAIDGTPVLDLKPVLDSARER
jgi:tRNA-Thr(GGU) m(6)t(6)A37 methyltransferase TsaA